MGSTASGATFNLSFGGLNTLNGKNYLGTWTLHLTNSGTTAGSLTAWSLNPVSVTANPQVLETAAVVSGGTGYKVGDYITLQRRHLQRPAAELQVFSMAPGGVITGDFTLFQPGLYSVAPSGTVSVAGGSGSGATFTVTSTADGPLSQTFRISLPTQTISGTYSIQFGPDNKANYIADTALHSATVVEPAAAVTTSAKSSPSRAVPTPHAGRVHGQPRSMRERSPPSNSISPGRTR